MLSVDAAHERKTSEEAVLAVAEKFVGVDGAAVSGAVAVGVGVGVGVVVGDGVGDGVGVCVDVGVGVGVGEGDGDGEGAAAHKLEKSLPPDASYQ